MPSTRQTLLFSATMPPAIVKLANKYTKSPTRISVGSTTEAAPNVRQELIQLSEDQKYPMLLAQLLENEGTTLVFVKTKFGAERMAKRLCAEKHRADALHGDLRQSRRDRVVQDYRDRKFRILVATDVAARGLDISHIETVINYDLPQCPEDYIHRVGRTARAGAKGVAINLLTPSDREKWRAIHRLMNPGAALPDDLRGPSPRKSAGKPGGYQGRRAAGGKSSSHRGQGQGSGGGQRQGQSQGQRQGKAPRARTY